MNQVNTRKNERNQDFDPIELLKLGAKSSERAGGYLKVISNSCEWKIHFHQGKLIYATNSLDPFERLERHLRRLNHQIDTINSEVRTQLRLNFESQSPDSLISESDYQGICWLIEKKFINNAEIGKLVKSITQEVFESYLLLQRGEYKFISTKDEFPSYFTLDWQVVLGECQKKLQAWQALGPQVWSPYQRPYFFSQDQAKYRIPLETQRKLSKILRGFNFRQLAALLDEDELEIARGLQPLIKEGVIILRNPQPPFEQLPIISPDYQKKVTQQPLVQPKSYIGKYSNDQLPKTKIDVNKARQKYSVEQLAKTEIDVNKARQKYSIEQPPKTKIDVNKTKQKYKIACIDDSPTILDEINRFLEDESISVSAISDPVKALRDIIRIQPDLILLDVGMPTIDGYKLCRLIRNHSLFKTKPIVMVTGNTGIIDRAKARLAGATDYMTKPFTQSQLVKMVYKYLN
ncbi:MAG: response regulator [Prochloraceae cyanobacterium]